MPSICKYNGECKKQACFALPGHKATRCKTHSEAGMIDVISARCAYDGCNKRPTFAMPGERASHCKTHSEAGMIDVKSARCAHDGCNKHPVFAMPGAKKSHCKTHSEAGMIDVRNARCAHDGCNKHPTFAMPGERASHCKTHSEAGMIDVKNARCVHDGCNKQPVFAMSGERASHCKTHSEAGMIDVKHARCAHDGCATRALYGPLFQLAIHCAKHKLKSDYPNNMRKPKCTVNDCKAMPTHTDTGNYPLRCDDHRLPADTNVIERPCETCGIASYIAAGNVCNDCADFIKIKNDRVRDEHVIRDLLNDHKIECANDKIPHGSCNRYRPDFLIDCNNHFVIIEVDEHQHAGYQCECEQARMINMAQDIGGGLPVRFIRFNPDAYIDNLGKRHIKKISSRHAMLVDMVKRCAATKPEALLSVIYLFYDGYNPNNIGVHEIDMDVGKLSAAVATMDIS